MPILFILWSLIYAYDGEYRDEWIMYASNTYTGLADDSDWLTSNVEMI